jgi:hypothetical protein
MNYVTCIRIQPWNYVPDIWVRVSASHLHFGAPRGQFSRDFSISVPYVFILLPFLAASLFNGNPYRMFEKLSLMSLRTPCAFGKLENGLWQHYQSYMLAGYVTRELNILFQGEVISPDIRTLNVGICRESTPWPTSCIAQRCSDYRIPLKDPLHRRVYNVSQ